MRMEYCAYSFLSEDGSLCDYEIATDELASMTAVCAHHVKHIKRKDIQELVTLIYHANGSIRGKCAIQKHEVMRLHAMYEFYFVKDRTFCFTSRQPWYSIFTCFACKNESHYTYPNEIAKRRAYHKSPFA